jgi:hypothetical protein
MPKHIRARAAQDEQEESQVRKLARSHHAPADWKFHAKMVIESWAGKTQSADRSRAEVSSQNGAHPSGPLQYRGDQCPGHAIRVRTQAKIDRTGAQPDSRPGEANPSRAIGEAGR